MNENIFSQVKSYMKSKFYSFNESWLKECADYCAETHPKLSIEGIQSFAKEQWLLSNLREINNENGTLPKNLVKQRFTILHGRYILQIEKMYDISTSKYKQLEKIRNFDVVNLKVTDDKKSEFKEPKGNRMYQLFLTDGVQDIQAMEYKPIKFFNETLLPGCKLMIIGPVTCRRGIIMLEEKHISGLGGEVEDLLISNSLENVLARLLNLKENPDPYNNTKQKEESEKSDLEEEFQEYLNDLEKLAHNQESNGNVRPSSNLSSSFLTLQPSSKIDLQKTSTEQKIGELLTEDEFEELLLNDPDIIHEFSSVEYVPNPINLQKLDQKSYFKVPSKPSLKATEKRTLSTNNSNQISRPVKNLELQDDSFFFDNKKGELSRSWDNLKEINSGYYKTSLKTTPKIESATKVSQSEAILESQDDDLILDDEDLIIFDSWDNAKEKTSNFEELYNIEKSSAVQPSKLSNNNLGITESLNGKSLEHKKPSGPCQPFTLLLSKSSSDAGLEIKKLESISKSWQIISSEATTSKLKVIEKPKMIVEAGLGTKTSFNENIFKNTNSFGIPKPYKPLFPKKSPRITEKSTNAHEDMETEKTKNETSKGLRLFSKISLENLKLDLQTKTSDNEPNKSLDNLNADLDLRMKKLLNEPIQHFRESFSSSAKSTSKIQGSDSFLRFQTEMSENGSEEITIGSKRSAEPVLSFSTPHKIHCRSDCEKKKITPRNEELPPKFCDFICNLIKEPLTDEVIRKTVRATIKEKGQLTLKDRRWNLDGLISDGTADLKVEFSTEFMDSVIGYTSLDFSLIKKKARNDPKLAQRIRTSMRNAQHKLEESDWLMQLEMAQNKTSVVVNGTELTEEQRTVFEKRLHILKPQYAIF